MAGASEDTPLLADNNHPDSNDAIDSDPLKASSGSPHFKLPITILSILASFLSFSVFGILIATYVLMITGPFQYIWISHGAVRDLAIILFVNFILSTLMVSLRTPVIVNMPVNIAMSIVIFVFSDEMFGKGWPDSGYSWCLPRTQECMRKRDVIRIMMGVSAGVAMLTALLLVVVILLELTALARAIISRGKSLGKFSEGGSTGITVQFSGNHAH